LTINLDYTQNASGRVLSQIAYVVRIGSIRVQGERLVQKELRRTLLKYKLHTDQELFDKAYEYIRQYY